MDSSELQKQWYGADIDDTSSSHDDDIDDKIFAEATARFSAHHTHDERKRTFASQATSLRDVQDTISQAKQRYESSRSKTKIVVSTWLNKLAVRLRYYGKVLDVLAQHHPEYVSLAWGAMKFLFIAIQNHENVITCLVEGLSRIADVLPRAELATMLYPTARMKVAVRELYTHLLRFFIRAHDWYQESPWRHALHAITRPVELRYTDLLDKIAECSQAIDQLAISGSQAEVRVMHRKLDALLSVPRKIDIIMSKLNHFGADIQEIQAYQSVHSSALVDTNQRLSDLQISQILTFVSTVPLADPIKSFQYCLSMRNRHQPNSQRGRSNAIWLSPKLRAWSHSRDSDLIIVKGTFQSRFVLRNFCVDVIRQLRASNVPVLWAMRTTHEKDHSSPGPVSSIDLLKYMVLQALRLSPTTEQQQQTEKSMALNCTRFQSATTEQEWLQLLESVLIGINRPVYLILDMQLLDSDLCLPSYFHWPAAWLNLFQALAGRGLQTKVKVLLYGYGSASHLQTSDERIGHIVLRPNHTLRASVRNARNRNKARIRGRIFEVP